MSNNLISRIRGFAVASVFLFHLYPSIISLGYLGVDIFIVISGFLIAKSFKHKNQSKYGPKDALGFIKKRFFRIYPSLVTFIFIIFLLQLILFGLSPSTSLLEELFAALFSSYNWHIISLFDYNRELMSGSPILHLWSISAEVQLYLVFLFLIYLARYLPIINKYEGLIFFLTSVFFLLIGSKIITLNEYFSSTWRLAEFSLGVILFLHGWRFFIISGLFFCLISFYIGADSILLSISISIFLISLFKLLDSFISNIRFFSHGLESLGNKSYSYYLCHFPLIFYLNYFIDNEYLKSFLAIIFTFILSELMYFMVEKNRAFLKFNFFKFNFSVVFIFFVIVLSTQNNFNRKVESLSSFEDKLDPPFIDKCRKNFGQKIKDLCILPGEGDLNIALIGDSHAFQLSGGFKRSDYKNLYIFSYAGCPPIKNFIRQDRLYMDCDYPDREWKKMIMKLNPIDFVFITSRWPYYFKENIGAIGNVNSSLVQNFENIELFDSLKYFNSKNIFLIADTPEVKLKAYDLHVQNIVRNRFKLEPKIKSEISAPPKNIKSYLRRISENNGVNLYSPNLKICNTKECTIISPTKNYYFRDTNHLSSESARFLILDILDNEG